MRSFGSAFLMLHSDSGNVNYILYTLGFETLLPNMLVVLLGSDIKISAMYVNSGISPKCFDLLFISGKQGKFTSWQDMLSPYLESFTPAFCAEAPEAESVN